MTRLSGDAITNVFRDTGLLLYSSTMCKNSKFILQREKNNSTLASKFFRRSCEKKFICHFSRTSTTCNTRFFVF